MRYSMKKRQILEVGSGKSMINIPAYEANLRPTLILGSGFTWSVDYTINKLTEFFSSGSDTRRNKFKNPNRANVNWDFQELKTLHGFYILDMLCLLGFTFTDYLTVRALKRKSSPHLVHAQPLGIHQTHHQFGQKLHF